MIAGQAFYHLFHIVDFRFLNLLGGEALRIHSSQFSFILLGQAIGIAGATSSLVFWQRKECVSRQGSIFLKHLGLTLTVCLLSALPMILFADSILRHFQIPADYFSMAKGYLFISAINLVLFGLYGTLDGMLVASNQQKQSLKLIMLVIFFNFIADFIAVEWVPYATDLTYLSYSLYIVGLSSTFILLAVIAMAFRMVKSSIHEWNPISFKELLPVWGAECGLGFVRAGIPLIFFFQMASISSSLLITHQMCLNIGFLFFIPVLSGMRIAILDASKELSYNEVREVPQWWSPFLFTAVLPSVFLMGLGIMAAEPMLRWFFAYVTPIEHLTFISIFFVGCLFDIASDVLIVPLRARKKNLLVTRNLISSEIFLLAGMQVFVYFQVADPTLLGLHCVLYALFQLVLNYSTWARVHAYEPSLLELKNFKLSY